jgi:hypothetical protein
MKFVNFMITIVFLLVCSFYLSADASENFQEKFKVENKHLIVSVGENHLFQLTDRQTGVVWKPDPWEATVGELNVTYKADLFGEKKEGGNLSEPRKSGIIDISKAREVTCQKTDDRTVKWNFSGFSLEGIAVKGRMAFELTLAREKPVVELTITDLTIEDENIEWEKLDFLPRWFALTLSSDSGYIVVPHCQGFIFPVGDTGLDRRDWMSGSWSYGQLPYSKAYTPIMHFYGIVNRSSAMYVRMEALYETNIQFLGNEKLREDTPRLSSVYPVVFSSMRELSYPRKFVVEIIPNGSYVDMAKKYRKWLKSIGMYKSLKEKIAELPSVEKLVGSPMVWMSPGYYATIKAPEVHPRYTGSEKFTGTFEGIPRMLRTIKEAGVERAFVNIWGWEYSKLGWEPDHWPPNEKLGGLAEFKKIFSRELRKEFPQYIMGFYNCYNDMYVGAPSFDREKIIKNADGSLAECGFWSGGMAYYIDPSQYRFFAEKHIAAYQRELELVDCMFYDNFLSLLENYNPRHRLTRTETEEIKRSFIEWTVGKGFITGVEICSDWIAPYVHYADGVVGAYSWYSRGWMQENIVPIPLWDLVFHESMVNYWWHWNNYAFSSDYVVNRAYHWIDMALQDILCANPGAWAVVPETYEYWSKIMGQLAPVQTKISKSLAHVEMTGHEFLERSCMVQKTTWADGTEIYVNFRDKKFTKEGITLAPKSFYLTGSTELGEMRGVMVEGFKLLK